VEPRKGRFFEEGRSPFEGAIHGTSFQIRRIIGYRNSFAPEISGTVSAYPTGGSLIAIRMTLHPFVLAFGGLCFGILLLNLGSTCAGDTEGAAVSAVGSTVLLLFIWALVAGAFSFESHKATQVLTELLLASKVEAMQ
jgi:hypothetical protein